MVFSSVTFLFVFLPLVILGYYFCPSTKWKNLFLLLASILFYAWGEPRNVVVLLISILINYKAGLLLYKKSRKSVLAIAILANLSFLFYFKYFGFSSRVLDSFLNLFNMGGIGFKDLILPIGISFYTFQSISYLVDVYRDKNLAQKNLISLGLYIVSFPQLIAGPIVRYHDISKQITNRIHNINLFSEGVERFIIGLSKKVLVANVVGEVADKIFSLPIETVPIYYAWVGILAYSLQIYYDFSGYSDMAIGLGKMFGFKFLENFNYPYISKSITEFWRRWHISLSNWFKDYVYIPLGGNRRGLARTIINLLLVFFITGLWHGASYNFIIWGLGHGIFISLEKILKHFIKFKENIVTNIIGHIYTMFTVVILWVLFRTGTKSSIDYIAKMFGFGDSGLLSQEPAFYVDTKFYLIFIIGVIFAMPLARKISEYFKKYLIIYNFKYLILIFLLLLSCLSVMGGAYNPFIYFRF